MADLDEKAAKRAEKQVAALFGLSSLGTVAVHRRLLRDRPRAVRLHPRHRQRQPLQRRPRRRPWRWPCSACGVGAVHWAKTLMPDAESVEERHPQRATDADRQRVVDQPHGGWRQGPAQPSPPDQVLPRSAPSALLAVADPAPPRRRARPAAQGRSSPPPCGRRATAWSATPSAPRSGPTRSPSAPSTTCSPSPSRTPSTSSRTRPRPPCCYAPQPRGHQAPEGARLGPRGHRRLLQDLHPRRLPRGSVRAADAPPALPLPPVDLRRDAGLQGHLRPGQAPACPS